ncbi:HesB/YadR/YfhF family protein [Virgibacillus sp. W0430]|uniref:HesB/YadR/YfhF family protein n=1 Tax=Virgibacillus sp. W0430 TaxID=3391580 RepID=UPI003F465E19
MKLKITEKAANWYIQELNVSPSNFVRFFVRYGGYGGIVPGFSLGVGLDKPVDVHTATTMAHCTFYIEDSDAWYFDGNNLNITFDDELQEPKINYE